MKLEDFVGETLKQIISGVAKAKVFAENNNASINPVNVGFNSGNKDVVYDVDAGVPLQQIEFDIAVTVIQSENSSGSKSASVGDISVSSPSEDRNISNSSYSRIKFSVPLKLPTSGIKDNHY